MKNVPSLRLKPKASRDVNVSESSRKAFTDSIIGFVLTLSSLTHNALQY